jgi:hypothetical protein
MPHLDFELRNPCLTFEGDEYSDEWRFDVSGKCTKKKLFNQSFAITSGGKSYNGIGAEAFVHLIRNVPQHGRFG